MNQENQEAEQKLVGLEKSSFKGTHKKEVFQANSGLGIKWKEWKIDQNVSDFVTSPLKIVVVCCNENLMHNYCCRPLFPEAMLAKWMFSSLVFPSEPEEL